MSEKNEDLSESRLKIVLISAILFALVLFFRLFQKQVLENKTYLALAEKQQTSSEEIPARRGRIFVKEGASTSESQLSQEAQNFPVATEMEKFQITVIPKQVKDAEKTAFELASILDLDKNDLLKKIENQKPYLPPIKKRVDKDVADKVSALNLPGVLTVPDLVRFYPEKEFLAQVLGFVNFEGKGNYGIEGYYDAELRGFSGEVVSEKDTKGRSINLGQEQEPQNGTDFVLTIDHNIQFMAEEKLKEGIEKYQAEGGGIIILDPKTGAVLAMASSPAFDPNNFNEIPKESQNIFLNPNVNEMYEPGSVFKPVIVASGLDSGAITPDSEGVFGNYVVVDKYEIHNSTDTAYGRENITQILEHSDNVGMVWVSEQLGKDKIAEYLQKFGFGKKTGIDLTPENGGKVDPVKNWSNAQRATISFGQGISVTPLQIISAISTIANGGKLMKAHLVDKMIRYDGKETQIQPQEVDKPISEDSAKKVTEMMISVVERGFGQKAKVDGYKIAGKTGTAQIPNPNGGYLEDASIQSFVGFAPADDAKFAMLIKLDRPKAGRFSESTAAVMFGEISRWLLRYFQIPPSQ